MPKVSRGHAPSGSVPVVWQSPGLFPEATATPPAQPGFSGSPECCAGIASSRLALGPLQSSGDPLPSTGAPHRGFVPPGKTSPSLFGIHSKSGRLLTVGVLGTELVQLQPAF